MKTKILMFIFIFSFTTSVFADCYSAWNEAFEDAETERISDYNRCERAKYSKAMCIAEAESAFGSTIDKAGTTFYHCVL